MINGKDLKKQGWEQGPWIGQAIALSQELKKKGWKKTAVWDLLNQIRNNPDGIAEDEPGFRLAELFIARRESAPIKLKKTPGAYKIWGRHLIPENTFVQMNQAMELPVTVAGALMPDAHLGYGIPIGGVVALDNAVAPYMVGVDIACRMMMTIYSPDETSFLSKNNEREQLCRTMRSETRFGINAGFDERDRRESWVLDAHEKWGATPLLRSLHEKACRQLGSSGGGNHFVDAGLLQVSEYNRLGLAPGIYFALMSHSGSRGIGASIARYYSAEAMKERNLPKSHKHLAWLDFDSALGQEYWHAMQLAGDFASECHHAIHRTIAKKLKIRPVKQVENHHNFAWKEQWQGNDVIVHRKGATPAHKGVLGIIPGSQGHDSFLVEGLGKPESLYSASHGAGRKMSRKAAINALSRSERDQLLKMQDIELLGSSMDEAPGAYKDIRDVLAAQSDLVGIVGTFKPKLVLMAE